MKYLFIFCQLFTATATLAQQYNLPLQFKTADINLGVGKDGCVALTTSLGEVGLADPTTGDWRRVDFRKGLPDIFRSAALTTPCFFNKDTGFVSGYITSHQGSREVIYRTTDGGNKWQAVKYGQDGGVDAAFNNDDGEAWLSVRGSGITYTADYGLTWKKFKFPEKGEQYNCIFFNTTRQGITGSFENTIAYTSDNCKTWKKLPSPLDQGKYNKTDRTAPPQFTRVAIFKDYFLAVQENLVFYSKRDAVNWVWLPDYTDFFTDADNTALFLKMKDRDYVRVNDNFKPVYSLDVDWANYDAKCKNGSLFVVCREAMVQLTPENTVVSTLYKGKTAFNKEPAPIGYRKNNSEVGVLDNRIFERSRYNEPWKYLFTFPIPLDSNRNVSVRDTSLLYYHGEDSLFYFNFAGNLLKKVSKRAMVNSFGKSGIKQIVFRREATGHEYYVSAKLHYSNLGNEFALARALSDTIKMPVNNERIDVKEVNGFIDQLPAIFNSTHMASIEELGFSENDYEQCRKDILEFQASLSKKDHKETSFIFNRNNLDFKRLLSLVDSIKYMDTSMVAGCLMYHNHYFFDNTMTYAKKIELLNNNNEVLSIVGYDNKPDGFYLRWSITLNGYTIHPVDLNINSFIKKIYPSFLDGPNKVGVLYTFVKMLYR